MTEESRTGIEKRPRSGRSPARKEKSPKRQTSPLSWDFESCFPSEPSSKCQGRIRASSWDDSDDNLPPIPDIVGSKTSRIYTSDERPKTSVSSEINELKKQFFKTREMEGNVMLETENTGDRRLSPARIRRRSRSSGSSSPVLEMESQVSPKQTNKSSGSDTELQDISPKVLQYDPAFYLNNFFTELRSRRISLIDPVSVIESIEKDLPKYDSEITGLDGEDLNAYFGKTSRKLSQILEVEETRKEAEKSSEENMSGSLVEKCSDKPTEGEPSPLPTSRSKKSAKTSEEEKNQKEKYKSFSSEYLGKPQKWQNQGNLSERSPKFFDKKLDEGFISLSAKTGKTQLSPPDDGMDEDDKAILRHLEDERNILESLKIDFMKSVENVTPRKSTDRSDHSRRSRSGKSSCNAESPKFTLNIGRDSERSLKVEDLDDLQRKENTEESNFSKNISEHGAQHKTERIPPLMLDSPTAESVASTRSLKKQVVLADSSKSQNSGPRSRRKTRRHNENQESEDRTVEETKRASPKGGHGENAQKNSPKTTNKETEHVPTHPSSKSSRISKLGKVRTPRTTESRSTSTPRSSRISELNLQSDISERPESQKASRRSIKTADSSRKGSDRAETKQRSNRPSDRDSRNRNTGSSPRMLKTTPRTNSGSSRRSKDSLENREELDGAGIRTWKEFDTVSNHSYISSVSSWREAETPNQQHSYRSDNGISELENPSKQQLSRSRNSSRTSVESNVTEGCSNSPEPNSCTVKQSPTGNEKTQRSFHQAEDDREEENSEETHGSHKIGGESDRLSHKRLSVINEDSVEDLEKKNVSDDETDTRQDTNRTSPDRTSREESPSIDFCREEWNDLINKFNPGREPFVLEKFPGFPLQKDISWSQTPGNKMELNEKAEGKLFCWNKTQRNALYEKSLAENLNNLVYEDKTKQEEFSRSSQNIYFLNVANGGSFGIGEFGDVTCWNSGDSDIKNLETPKDHGDGIPMRISEVRLQEKAEKEVTTQPDSQDSTLFIDVEDDTDFANWVPCRLKTSKSDNCLNVKVSEGSKCQTSADSFLGGCKYKSETTDLPVFGTQKKTSKHTSKSAINENSSFESLCSEKNWENLEFAYERTPRLSRSLSNRDIRIYQREQSETLSLSGSELFKRTAEKKDKDRPTLNSFLARRAKEDKMAAKSGNWLKLKRSPRQGKKAKTKSRKKSRDPLRDYLSSRKGRPQVPGLKLRNPNCFQNFYKRFISVFCLTSNSSAATSK